MSLDEKDSVTAAGPQNIHNQECPLKFKCIDGPFLYYLPSLFQEPRCKGTYFAAFIKTTQSGSFLAPVHVDDAIFLNFSYQEIKDLFDWFKGDCDIDDFERPRRMILLAKKACIGTLAEDIGQYLDYMKEEEQKKLRQMTGPQGPPGERGEQGYPGERGERGPRGEMNRGESSRGPRRGTCNRNGRESSESS